MNGLDMLNTAPGGAAAGQAVAVRASDAGPDDPGGDASRSFNATLRSRSSEIFTVMPELNIHQISAFWQMAYLIRRIRPGADSRTQQGRIPEEAIAKARNLSAFYTAHLEEEFF